jgi:hypothetical protein
MHKYTIKNLAIAGQGEAAALLAGGTLLPSEVGGLLAQEHVRDGVYGEGGLD